MKGSDRSAARREAPLGSAAPALLCALAPAALPGELQAAPLDLFGVGQPAGLVRGDSLRDHAAMVFGLAGLPLVLTVSLAAWAHGTRRGGQFKETLHGAALLPAVAEVALYLVYEAGYDPAVFRWDLMLIIPAVILSLNDGNPVHAAAVCLHPRRGREAGTGPGGR